MAFQHQHAQELTSMEVTSAPLAESERCWLRPFSKGDLLQYWKAINDPEIAHFTGHCPPVPYEEVEFWYAQSVLRDSGSLDTYMTICMNGSESFTGSVWLWNSNALDGHCELSVFVSEKDLWSTGIGTEAVRLAVGYAFEQLGHEKVWLHVDEWNRRAVKCYEKCGFEHEGVLRKHRRMPDGWSNMAVMSILRAA